MPKVRERVRCVRGSDIPTPASPRKHTFTPREKSNCAIDLSVVLPRKTASTCTRATVSDTSRTCSSAQHTSAYHRSKEYCRCTPCSVSVTRTHTRNCTYQGCCYRIFLAVSLISFLHQNNTTSSPSPSHCTYIHTHVSENTPPSSTHLIMTELTTTL